jgi:hypothetical protein
MSVPVGIAAKVTELLKSRPVFTFSERAAVRLARDNQPIVLSRSSVPDSSTLRRFSGPIAAKLRYRAVPRHPILELGAAAAKCGVGGAFVARAIELRITNEPLLASRRQRQRLVSARETSRPRRRCSDPGRRCSRSYYPNTERRFGRGGRSSRVPSRRTVRGR